MKPRRPLSSSTLCVATISLLATLTSCKTTHYAVDDLNAERAVATARSIAPGLRVEEVEREKEFGKISWTVEGEVRGQNVEIEFGEKVDQSADDSAKAIQAK